MGFIAYQHECSGADEVVRVYLECQDAGGSAGADGAPGPELSCSYAVDVIFPGGPNGDAPCRLRGVEDILALKKFYKLVFSLEERAREHGHSFHAVFDSPDTLMEHLAYTRNARRLYKGQEPRRRPHAPPELEELECRAAAIGSVA